MVWSSNNQLAVHGVEFFAPFRAELFFGEMHNPRVAQYFRRPLWAINRDLLRHREGQRTFPPLDWVKDDLPGELYATTAERLRQLAAGNFFWAAVVQAEGGELAGGTKQ